MSVDRHIPMDIEIILSNDTIIEMASLERAAVSNILGAPIDAVTGPQSELIETFKARECSATFINGKFAYLHVRKPAQIMNLRNRKSITLPATHAEIRRVFGDPTSIGEAESQQP
jgi:hypothetical protein